MRSGLPCTILAAVAEHEREAISAVAPFTGVRIETSWRAITRSSSAVAPFTGARIETDNLHRRAKQIVVAPFTGARIETFRPGARRWRDPRSLPSRGRGSKRCRRRPGTEHLESLPSRGRGSKQHGARIPAAQSAGRSLHEGADRNPIAQLITASTLVAPFTGGSPLAPRGEWWQRLVPTQRQDPPRSNE
jgi:hypothetical protein